MGWRGAGVGFSLLISRWARLSKLNARNARTNRPPIAAAAAAGTAPRLRTAVEAVRRACAECWRDAAGQEGQMSVGGKPALGSWLHVGQL